MSSNDNPTRREPDELDALLERSCGDRNSAASPSSQKYGGTDNVATLNDASAPNSRGHRKAHTVGVGNMLERTGGRVRGLFGRPNTTKRHRKNKSSISDLIDAAVRSVDLDSIADDFRQTASSVKHTLVEELEEMDQGVGSGFFDMTATRNFAIIPDDMLDFGVEVQWLTSSSRGPMPRVEELGPDEETAKMELDMEEETPTNKGRGSPMIINLLLLLVAVFAHSSNSTALHMLDGVSPTMKLFWRMSASYLILVPFAILYLRREGFPKLSCSGWTTFVSAAAFYTCSTLCFYTALEYTTIGNAVIYANSQALLLIVGKVFIGEPIHVFEGIGVVVAFSGAILCSKDSEETSAELDVSNALFGDLLALCSAAFGVAYLTVARVVRSQMSVMFFITFVMFLGSLMVLAYLAINPHEEVSIDMDPFHGIFGGFDITHGRLEVMAYLAIVVNVGGSMGMIRAMQHFETIIIAVATLMEPLAASLIAFVCKAGLLPGPLGWLGNFLVVFGTLCVVYPSMGKVDGGGIH
ncbi:MAG: hypothetical protein SGILL_001284 [Bacillariaceae sp.]